MSNSDQHTPSIERELQNSSIHDLDESLAVIEDDLHRLAEHTDAEYVHVELKPLTKEQHEANEALRDLVASRGNTDG
jgi:hypothetical protein